MESAGNANDRATGQRYPPGGNTQCFGTGKLHRERTVHWSVLIGGLPSTQTVSHNGIGSVKCSKDKEALYDCP